MTHTRLSLVGTGVFLTLLVGSVWIIEVLIPSLEAHSVSVRLPVQKILTSQALSAVTGEYWENEMWEQGKIIQQLSLDERLNFYLLVLLNCKLDTSRAFLFSEMVGRDASPLKDYLIRYATSQRFEKLSSKQQMAVKDWIVEMDIVSNLPDRNRK